GRTVPGGTGIRRGRPVWTWPPSGRACPFSSRGRWTMNSAPRWCGSSTTRTVSRPSAPGSPGRSGTSSRALWTGTRCSKRASTPGTGRRWRASRTWSGPMCSRWSCGGCSSQKQGDGAVHQQQGHDRVHRPGVPGEQKAEHRPEGRPGQGEYKPDGGQQQGKEQQYGRLSAIVGEDVGLHGQDAVEINFRVDELEEQAGPEPLPGVVLLDRAGAAEGAPGQIEHIGRPQHQHGQPDGGDQ